MFTGPVGPVEVFFYWPKAVFGNFYWPWAIGSPFVSSPVHIKTKEDAFRSSNGDTGLGRFGDCASSNE